MGDNTRHYAYSELASMVGDVVSQNADIFFWIFLIFIVIIFFAGALIAAFTANDRARAARLKEQNKR